MNGRLVNVSLCFMSGMKRSVKNVEKDMSEDVDNLKEAARVLIFTILVGIFTFGCLEYRFWNKRTGESILWFLLICSIPLWMISKALTNDRKS